MRGVKGTGVKAKKKNSSAKAKWATLSAANVDLTVALKQAMAEIARLKKIVALLTN